MQIRARLTLMFMAIAAGILATVLFAVWLTYKTSTEAVFFQNLESRAALTARTVFQNVDALTALPVNWLEPDDADTLPYRENVSLYNEAYQRVFTMRPDAVPVAVKTLQDIQQAGRYQFRNQNLHALGLVMQSPSQRPFTIVAEGFCDPGELIRLRNILITGFLFGILVLAASGWYFAGQALAPVSRIMNQVNRLQPDDLSRRVETGANRDELARLAETFNSLLDRVERAFRMQRLFLSNVSHELKNPLMAIRAQLDVTLQRDREPAAYKKALQSVLEDIHALSDVEEKLLQLARIYNNPNAIPLKFIRLDELLYQAKDQLQKNQPGYRVALEFGEMPDSGEALLVRANESLLRTALLNMMQNACKYSPDQRVSVRVFFQPDGAHRIDVCDNGPGIPAEEQALIFEPFYRSPQHRGSVKGTGIGLALVRSILQLHHIALEFRAPETGGATFQLLFPAIGRTETVGNV